MNYKQVQGIAKETMEYAKQHIKAGMNLLDVRRMCEEKMLELGADSFWYWDVGAFVFSGDETTVSVSGTEYVTSDRSIDENDIVTIDLSPQNKGIWGDYARTLIVQNGIVVDEENINNIEWNKVIEDNGFVNLDFMGNLGHSIVKEKKDRIYIEKGNHTCLGDVTCFTFEPHIAVRGSKYGYKKENIYYFENEKLKEL